MKLKKIDVALIAIIAVVAVAGAAYWLSISGSTGNTVTTTIRLEFGPTNEVTAPFHPGNDTVWTKSGNGWTATTSPNASGGTSWTFEDVSSASNCWDQLLVAVNHIGGFHIDSENQTLGLIVTGIGHIGNLQYHSRAWQYYVDGVYANMACNLYAIHDGDTVIWRYITNQAS